MTISRDSGTFNQWTPGAINCYERNMHCNGCIDEEFCNRRGQDITYGIKPMKYAVLVLYSKYGKPERREYVDESTDGHT